MFRYLNPARIFRTSQGIGPTEPPITDPTTTETQMKVAASVYWTKRFRIRDQESTEEATTTQTQMKIADSEYRTKRFRITDQESIEEEPDPPNGRKMRRKKKMMIGKLRLRSSDGVLFEVDMEVIVRSSERIRAQVEGHVHGHGGGYFPGEVIGVPEVASDAMAVAIDYCEKRAVDEEDELKEWVLGLFRADQSAFFDLTLAAYHLKIKSLLDLTSQVMADMLRGKSPIEIKNILNIQGDTNTTLLPPSAHGV